MSTGNVDENSVLWLDLETRSPNSIKSGIYKYAEGSEILLMAYAIGGSNVTVYDCHSDIFMPEDLADALENPNVIIRTHGDFDRVLMRYHGFDFPIYRHENTMDLARSCSLPGGLDKLCKIFNISDEFAKLDTGKELIRFFCVPKKNGKYNNPKDFPEKWNEFKQYAGYDILAMREVYKQLPKHNYNLDTVARRIYAEINDKGFKVDIDLAQSAIEAVGVELKLSKVKTAEITDSELGSVTQTAALLAYISEKTGKHISDLKGATVSALIKEGSLPKEVLTLLEMRQNVCKSSTAKYKRVIECVCEDGKLRGTMVFNGALRTRRNSGSIFNPLNLPRPSIKGEKLEEGVLLLKSGCGFVGRDSVMQLASSALRGVIIAEPGEKLVVSDWANIEGRLAAWYAGEEWKIQAFRDFDLGIGADLYKKAFAKMMNRDITTVNDDDERQIGKVAELALGYGGSVAAFVVFATGYGINLKEMASKIQITNMLAWEKAVKSYEYALKNKKLLGFDETTYKKLAYLVHLWRLAHPKIVSKWYEIDNKCKNAIRFNGVIEPENPLDPFVDDRFLIVPLPSGQRLMYLDPKVDDKGIVFTDGRYGVTRTYGSKIFENIIQSLNKDILCGVLPDCVAAGYDPRLTIYDELVTQTDDSLVYSEAELSKLMVAEKPWYKGLPLAAKGYESYYYRKG